MLHYLTRPLRLNDLPVSTDYYVLLIWFLKRTELHNVSITPSVPLSPHQFRLIADLLLPLFGSSQDANLENKEQNRSKCLILFRRVRLTAFLCSRQNLEREGGAANGSRWRSGGGFYGWSKDAEVNMRNTGSFLPDTSDSFNSPDRRVAPTTPTVLIAPDISTSSSGCRGRTVWRGHDSSWQGDCGRVGGVTLCETINGGF